MWRPAGRGAAVGVGDAAPAQRGRFAGRVGQRRHHTERARPGSCPGHDPAAPADRNVPGAGRRDELGEVHDEAEVLQHAVSELLIDRIDAALGHPRRDPHGDPIPPPSGSTSRTGRQRSPTFRRGVLPGGPGQRRRQRGLAVSGEPGNPARGDAAGAGTGTIRRAAVDRDWWPAPGHGNTAEPSCAWCGPAVTAAEAAPRGQLTLRQVQARGRSVPRRPCWAPRSWPPSLTSTRGTSRPTSPAAPTMAMSWCG